MSNISGMTGTKEPGRRRRRSAPPPPVSSSSGDEDDFEEVGEPEGPAPRQSAKKEPPPASTKGSKSADKVKQSAALTGQFANFPTLGMTQSDDPAFNISYVIHARLVTFKWKQLTWMLRARSAFLRSKMAWKRHPRWLAAMLSTDVASLWGHLGGTTKSLRGPAGPPLFR